MNDKTIEQYLAAYYNGTATQEEEKALVRFFSDTNVPERWQEEQQALLLLHKSSEVPIPEGLKQRLEQKLDNHISKGKRFTLRKTAYKITGIAAAILLCLGIAFYQSPFTDNSGVTADTYKDPHEAALVAGQALAFLSSNLNKGMEQVNEAEKEIQQVNEILNNQLK